MKILTIIFKIQFLYYKEMFLQNTYIHFVKPHGCINHHLESIVLEKFTELHPTCSTWAKLDACHVLSASSQSMPMLRPIIFTTALTQTTSTSSHYQWHRLIVLIHLQNSSVEFV
jgi:hypothetical protein